MDTMVDDTREREREKERNKRKVFAESFECIRYTLCIPNRKRFYTVLYIVYRVKVG